MATDDRTPTTAAIRAQEMRDLDMFVSGWVRGYAAMRGQAYEDVHPRLQREWIHEAAMAFEAYQAAR